MAERTTRPTPNDPTASLEPTEPIERIDPTAPPDAIDAIGAIGAIGAIASAAGALNAPANAVRQILDRLVAGDLDPVSAQLAELARDEITTLTNALESLDSTVATARAALADGAVAGARSTFTAKGPGHLLVVDDTAVNRTVLQSQLARLGHTSVTASDGAEALERMTQGGFDAVLMDWHMPGLDGLAAARAYYRQCEEAGTEPVPVIMVTASVSDEARSECRAAGTADFLAKPVGLDALRACLDRWIPAGRLDRGRGPDDPFPPKAELVDRATIDQLADELGGAQAVTPIIDAFIADSEQRREAMHPPANARHADARRAGHTIKSSAALLGAGPLAALAKELESAFDANHPPDPATLQRFDRLLNETLVVLTDIRDELERG